MVRMYKLAKGYEAVERMAHLDGWTSADELARSLGTTVDELAGMWSILEEVDVDIHQLQKEGFRPTVCRNIISYVERSLTPISCGCFSRDNEAYVLAEKLLEKLSGL